MYVSRACLRMFARSRVNNNMYFNTIPIQNWILGTISLELLESFFKGGDCWVWNEEWMHLFFAMYTGIMLDILKRELS